jgi:hypothetical protein
LEKQWTFEHIFGFCTGLDVFQMPRLTQSPVRWLPLCSVFPQVQAGQWFRQVLFIWSAKNLTHYFNQNVCSGTSGF